MSKGDKVEIDREDLDMLQRSHDLFTALMDAGVDNWDGWDYAMGIYREIRDAKNSC